VRARVWQVVTFALEPFRGNPAFVVGLDEDLPAEVLRSIGAQFCGVTAVLGPNRGDMVRLRFVTAKGAHPGAGHSAAAAAAVALEGRSEAEVSFEDGSRRLFWRDAHGRVVVPWPVMPWSPCDPGPTAATALGRAPEQWLAAPFGYVAVYPNQACLSDLAPDMALLATLNRNTVIVTAPGDLGESDIAIRVFAPKVGLPEDPVCGTAHRIIVPFWCERLGRPELHSRHLSARGGDLWCKVDKATVTIAGNTCKFLEGTVQLPT
jgi:predicted PhzF superfamily epimerase YddE/YHI9